MCSDPAPFPLSWNHTTPQWHTPSSSVMRILHNTFNCLPSPILKVREIEKGQKAKKYFWAIKLAPHPPTFVCWLVIKPSCLWPSGKPYTLKLKHRLPSLDQFWFSRRRCSLWCSYLLQLKRRLLSLDRLWFSRRGCPPWCSSCATASRGSRTCKIHFQEG